MHSQDLEQTARAIGRIASALHNLGEAISKGVLGQYEIAAGLHAIARAIASNRATETQKEGGA